MDVVSVLVAALSFVATEGAKGVVAEEAKNCYRSVKEFLGRHYPKVDLTRLEEVPSSAARRAVVVKDLTAYGAATDPAFAPLAKALIDAAAAASRSAGPQTGIELSEFEAASLEIDRVIASGKGIDVSRTKIAGPAVFRNITAGVQAERDSESVKKN